MLDHSIVAAYGNLDESVLRQRFSEVQWLGDFDFDTFMIEVKSTKERGWAIDIGTADGLWNGISAPVIGANSLQHVVSAVIFSKQFSADRIQEIGDDLSLLAANIGERLELSR